MNESRIYIRIKYCLVIVLKILIALLLLISIVSVAWGFKVINPNGQNLSDNLTLNSFLFDFFLPIGVSFLLNYLYSFFVFSSCESKRILRASIYIKKYIQWHMKNKLDHYIISIWRIHIDLKKICVRMEELVANLAFKALAVCVALILSFSTMIFIFNSFFEKEYERTCIETTKLFETYTTELLEFYICYKFDNEEIWDNQSLRNYLSEAISDDLMNLYDESAAHRAMLYIQSSQKYRKLKMPEKLTSIDVYTYEKFEGKAYSKKFLRFLNTIVNIANSEHYDEYRKIYNSYSELVQEYEDIIQSAEFEGENHNSVFSLQLMMDMCDKIEKLRLQIVAPEDVNAVRYHHSIPAEDTRIIDGHSESCISRLEQYHAYKTENIKDGLQYARRLIVFDCEDTFLMLYDKLGELKDAINALVSVGYEQDDLLSRDEMLKLVENGSIDAENDLIDCQMLEKMRNQLADHINYRYSADVRQTERQLEALDECIALYQLQDKVQRFKIEGILQTESFAVRRQRLSQLEDFLSKTELSGYVSDIQKAVHYFLEDNVLDHCYFLLMLPAIHWEVFNLNQGFISLQQNLLESFGLIFLLYSLIGIMGYIVQKNTKLYSYDRRGRYRR